MAGMGRRRRVREMERRLAELDDWDARYGVGGVPPGHPLARETTGWRYHSPDGLPPVDVHHRAVGGHRQRRRRRVWPSVLTVLALAAGVVALVEYPDETRAVTGQALQTGRELWAVATGGTVEAVSMDGDRADGSAEGAGADGSATGDQGFSPADLLDSVELNSPFGWAPASGERVLPPVEAPEDGPYAFVALQPGTDLPVGFSPCGVVEVLVNPDRAPRGYEELVTGSLERLTRASGLQLTLVGETDLGWDGLARRPRGPVVISWSDASEVPALAGQIAGLGGALTVSGPQGTWAAGGRVVLDVDAVVDLDGAQQAALLDHELAHVLGLDHVNDAGELMAPVNVGRTSFGPGDLAGLAAIGSIPCPSA